MKESELIDKGLIRKEKAKREEIAGSLELAKHFVQRAKGNMAVHFYDIAFLLAYTSMFHAARALLFLAGYKERSHFALIAVLKDKYKNNEELVPLLEILDSYRTSRHSIQYGGGTSSKSDASEAIKDSERLIAITNRIINRAIK